MRKTWRVAARGLLVVAAGVLGAGGAGCATYANYPAIGNDVAVNDPNVVPLPTLETVALRWVVDRYPVEGPYVLNLARGTERWRAESIAGKVGDGARIVSDETAELPVYHVSRIWLRADRAEVDVMRPVGEVHQMVTLWLKNDFGAWVVANTRAWPVGVAETPELYGWREAGTRVAGEEDRDEN